MNDDIVGIDMLYSDLYMQQANGRVIGQRKQRIDNMHLIELETENHVS